MRHTTAFARLAWALFALSYLCLASGFVLLVLGWSAPLPESTWGFRGFIGIVGAMFTNMGTMLSLRRPDHRIGWLFLVIGVLAAVQLAAGEYGIYAGLVRPGALPAAAHMAWLASWLWVPMLGVFLVFMCLLFPDGHLLSTRWHIVVWFGCAWIALFSFVLMFNPGPLLNYPFITNPLGIEEIGPALSQLVLFSFLIGLVVIVLSIGSLFLRWRRATGEQRQQLKWFAYAATIAGLALIPASGPPTFRLKVFEYIASLAILAVPPAVGFSILRYRLFDIDRVINRTLVYAVLTVLLALVYLVSVLFLRTLFRGLTGEQPEIVTVLSTLLIAALFVPLRGRVQTIIDRRLYRRKYDAIKTLEAFSIAVRDEVELSELREQLLGVVNETMQPAHVSLWLKPASRGHDRGGV
jgi:hypothetical protein